MGYYTNFELELKGSQQEISAFNKYIEQQAEEDDSLGYYIQEMLENKYQVKWYDHEQDMSKLSELFPNILFTLKGDGEESGDLWIKYFKNGLVQKAYAQIVYDKFDPSKLEKVKK